MMQRCTQVDEDEMISRSSQGDGAEWKQRRGPRRCSARSDKDMECPGLDHPWQNTKERPKQNDNKMRMKQTGRSGVDHPGQNKQQGPPPPGQDRPGTSGGQTPRTDASGTEQGEETAAP